MLAQAERTIAAKPGFLASLPAELTDEGFAKKIAALGRADNGCYLVAETEGQVVGHGMLDPLPLAATRHSPRRALDPGNYLLSSAHPVGRFKARFFARLGYKSDTWQRFEADLRNQHLPQDARLAATTEFGRKYEIRATLKGPLGPPALLVSVWFIPAGEDTPRFVTAYPGEVL